MLFNSNLPLNNDFGIFSQEYRGETGLRVETTEDLGLKVINFRDRFFRLFLSRYMELLPSVIKYTSKSKNPEINGIDWVKVEVALRNGYLAVIGKNRLGVLNFLGYSQYPNATITTDTFFRNRLLTKKDITFIIPENLIPTGDMKQISFYDNSLTGDFIVLQNKTVNLQNDYQIIYHYAESLAEIVTSRYSLILQSKALTFLTGEPNDETNNQIASSLYNGFPYLKVSKLFDKDDSILTIENSTLANNLAELKREYQNQLNELNSMIGLDVLGVDKTSGVSDIEAVSGNPFSKSVANIYVDSRKRQIDLLNQKYLLDICVSFDNNVSSEISQYDFLEGDDK